MYGIGSKVIYSEMGVCEILEIAEKEAAGKEKREFYVLKPVFENGTVFVPVDNPKVMMRSVISKDEAEKLIESIPTMQIESFDESSVHKLATYYKDLIHCQDCEKLLMLIISIYRKCERTGDSKKIGQTDKKFMNRAESLLFGELSVVLEMERSEIRREIQKRLAETK